MTDRLRCVILGAGGHAKVVIEALRASQPQWDLCLLDRPGAVPSGDARVVLGVPVIGDDSRLPELARTGVRCFVVGLGGTGDNRPRAALFRRGLENGLQPLTVLHPSAVISPSALLAAGCQVLAGAIVGSEARVDANVIVNSRAVVEHDCRVREHAHVASGAVLASTVDVGPGAHIGAGAVVRQNVRVGGWAIVGAGAAVVRDVPADETVVGVPARVLRREPGRSR